MNVRSLFLLVLAAAVVLPACTKRVERTSSTIAPTVAAGVGPQVSAAPLGEPPALTPPAADQCLFQVWVVQKGTGSPIGGAFVSLTREVPETLYMREPMRRSVVGEARTILHGRGHVYVKDSGEERNDLDGKMKWWLVRGPGFDPFLAEAGLATGGQSRTLTIEMEILPIAEFIVRAPNGDRANNSIVTMKRVGAVETSGDEGDKMGDRPGGSVNYGTTERADDYGEVAFNRRHGTYQILATDQDGRHRLYQTVEWTGDWSEPMVLQLPEQSMKQ